jgi:RNA methyltransferase, TrmH family
MPLKSASKNQIKEWKKLSMTKHRKKSGLFMAEGIRCVEQILENELLDVVEIVTDDSINLSQFKRISDIDTYKVSISEMASIADTETPQGVIAICRIPAEPDFEELIQSGSLIVALDALQDPGNMGTVIRTAAWFGAGAIIIGEGSVDPYHPKVVRSTAGATAVVPIVRADLETALNKLEEHQWITYLLDASNGSESISETDYVPKTVLVLGNEANGISPSLVNPHRKKIKIEGNADKVESLNASIAIGIVMYEFNRK